MTQDSMREVTNISSLGLKDVDSMVLHNILKLVQGAMSNFQVLAPNKPESADILFVEAGDEKSLKNLASIDRRVITIAIGDKANPEASDEDAITVRRPIVAKRVRSALEKAFSTRGGKAAEYEPITSANSVSRRKRVLVVDDSFPVREYMKEVLSELSDGSLLVSFAANGMEAVKKCQERNYDLIFLDVVMPDIDGYKICKWIKAERPETKVVMLTGKKSTFDKVRGAMSGCDTYLTKPPKQEKLKSIYLTLMLQKS